MLKFRPFNAPSNITFIDPDSGFKYSAKTKKALIERIIKYRSQNGYPALEHLDLVLENYWCSLPENVGKCINYKLNRGFIDMLKGSVFIIKNIFYGKENLTTLEEATARANICITCPFNVNPEPGPFDAWCDDIAMHSTDNAYLEMNFQLRSKLHNCEKCTCPLKAKVWYKGKIKLTEDEKQSLPNFCWQKDIIDE